MVNDPRLTNQFPLVECAGHIRSRAGTAAIAVDPAADSRVSTRRQKGVGRPLGFHFGAARVQHIQSVLPGSAIAIVAILGQEIDDMAEFMQQD